MRFGPVPVAEAVGAVSAYGQRLPTGIIRKGRVVTPDDVARLREAGIDTITVAQLEASDVAEGEAAGRLAEAVAGTDVRVEAPFTGRCNLFAAAAGLLVLDVPAVDDINGIDETVTLATLPAFRPVVADEMVATVKIIPYAAPGAALDEAVRIAAAGPVLRVAPWRRRRVGVVSTLLPSLKPATVAKTLRVLDERLQPAGAAIAIADETPHEAAALASALGRQARSGLDLIVVFGASAIADRRDVIPAAIEAVGGTVEHFGMPVDPGNLILLGRVGALPVIGAPGCARSPKENGFDWMLHRLLAGLEVTRRDITRLGVGGLLMEIVSRGQPRGGGEPDPAEDEDRD